MEGVESVENLRGALEEAEGRPVVHVPADTVVQVLNILDGAEPLENDELAHRLWAAILKHHSYEGQDRCHDIDSELYLAVGLTPKGPPACTREEWERGCGEYISRLFGNPEGRYISIENQEDWSDGKEIDLPSGGYAWRWFLYDHGCIIAESSGYFPSFEDAYQSARRYFPLTRVLKENECP